MPEPAPVTSATLFSNDKFIDGFIFPDLPACPCTRARLATDRFHQLFWIPFPLDRDLCGGGIDLPKVIGRQFHGERSNILVEAMQLGCAWNRDNPRLLGQHPSERDLCRCRLLPCCDCANQI